MCFLCALYSGVVVTCFLQLLLSSNHLSCDAARLDSASDLGEGSFQDPSHDAMKAVGSFLTKMPPFIQPFNHLVDLELPNGI